MLKQLARICIRKLVTRWTICSEYQIARAIMRNAHFRQTAVYGADFDVTVFHAVRLNSVIMSLALSVDDVHMRFALAMTT